ncbi:MAG: flavoprotein [Spirochaetales bacterium]|nr:flavoprotein [Spirochaetales bacterium]
MSKADILLHISGSVSAFKAASLASMLVKAGYQVQASLSAGGARFIGEATLGGITRRKVLTNLWEGYPDHVPHITLTRDWADLILVYPASANTINRLAAGLADDVIGAILLANNGKSPVWIAPAMNTNMFSHPAVQEGLDKLEKWGCTILDTGAGRMACGTEGAGRLLEPEQVFKMVEKAFGNATTEGPDRA